MFALLALLVENRERLVSKDEIVEKVWDGRVVSDAAVASRVKSARQALGDDGKAQRFIKTIHGRASASSRRWRSRTTPAGGSVARPGWRLRRRERTDRRRSPSRRRDRRSPCCRSVSSATPGRYAAIADAPAPRADRRAVAAALALRHRPRLVVPPARAGRCGRMAEVGRLLGVRYCLSGTVEIAGTRLAVDGRAGRHAGLGRRLGRPLRRHDRRRARGPRRDPLTDPHRARDPHPAARGGAWRA